MLSEIKVENAALIERAEAAFSGGFIAITGETGAGKSVFVSALSLLRGEKAPPKLVRAGASECRVTAVFTDPDPALSADLTDQGLASSDDDCLVLDRTVGSDGKSRCRINGSTVPLGLFRSVGGRLIQLSSQHQSFRLADSKNHLTMIDAAGDASHAALIDAYRAAYSDYRDARRLFEDTVSKVREAAEKKDYLKGVVKQLGDARLKSCEEDRLWERYRALENAGKISEAADFVRRAVDGTDKQKGAYDRVMLASSRLDGISDAAPDMKRFSQRLEEIAYELREIADGVEDAAGTDGENAGALMEKISARIELIRGLKKRYSGTEDELNAYLEKCREELETAVDGKKRLEKLKEDADAKKRLCLEAGERLEKSRDAVSEDLCRRVKESLEFLDMEKARFSVVFTPTEPSPDGIRSAEFFITANPGQPPQPLGAVASGGELSRIMLAIRAVLAEDPALSTLIFDEIDTGISGKTSRKLGLLLKKLSRGVQIIAVTHSAQIASLAEEHFVLKKTSAGKNTVSTVSKLDHNGRIDELARILGGISITDAVRQNAAELLDSVE